MASETREHNRSAGLCEACWGEAYLRTLSDPHRSQYLHYLDVIAEHDAARTRFSGSDSDE